MRRFVPIILVLAAVGCGGIAAPDESDLPVTADAVIQAFKDAGLEAENPSEITQAELAMVPHVCDGTKFDIPSLGKGDAADAAIYMCGSKNDAAVLESVFAKLGEFDTDDEEIIAPRMFRNDSAGVLLALPAWMDDATAAQYEEALAGIGQ